MCITNIASYLKKLKEEEREVNGNFTAFQAAAVLSIAFDDKCPRNIASKYTFERYQCSNGCTVQSKRAILAELKEKRSETRKVKRQIFKEKLDIRRKNELEYWLKENNIPVTLELTNGKVLVPLDVLEELKNRLNRANGR